MTFRALLNSTIKNLRLHSHSGHRKPRQPGRSYRAVHQGTLIAVSRLIFLPIALSTAFQAQSQQVGPPIIFVHGICDHPASWDQLRLSLTAYLNSNESSLYPNPQVYVGVASGPARSSPVNFFDSSDDPLQIASVPANARFFSIAFRDPNCPNCAPSAMDTTSVMQLSIAEKGDELAAMIAAVKRITSTPKVILIAHSMGGLDSRSYLENLGTQSSHKLGEDSDVVEVTTIDTPHMGSPAADFSSLASFVSNDYFGQCLIHSSEDMAELNIGSSVLQDINYGSTAASALPSTVSFDSMVNYVPSNLLPTSVYDYVGSFCSGFGQSPDNDGVVCKSSQSIANALASYPSNDPYPHVSSSSTPFTDTCPSGLGGTDLPLLLHQLGCVGAQQSTQLQVDVDVINNLLNNSIDVEPNTVTIASGQSQQFTAALNYSTPVVNWMLLEDPSSTAIDQFGDFQASSLGTYHVIATDQASGKQYGMATVFVKNGPTVSVTASPNPATSGAAVTLTATVETSIGVPTGEVTFYDGTSALAPSVELNTSGIAPYYATSLSTGVHSISAKYSGDANFTASSSSPVSVTVGNISPQIAVTPQNGTVGITTFTKSGTGFTPNGSITHTATWPDNTKSVLNGYADSTGTFNYIVTYSNQTGTYYQTDTDNTTGKASNTISWTVSPIAVNDFSLSPSPGSETISQGGSTTFSLVTTTISGSAQSVSLSASNAPSGMTVSFGQSVIASGGAVTFTVSAGSSVPVGTYLLTITGTGTSATHSSSVSVTVVQQPSSSAGSLASSPASFNFNPQTVDTASSPVVFSLVNSGGTAVTISSLTASPGFIPSFLNGVGIPITLQPNGGYANMQVVFIPTSVGTQTGTIKLFNSTNASPLTISLSGSGIGAPVTTGNIQINATFNGSPWSGNLYTSLTGPESYTDGQTPITHTELAPGGYTESYSAGGPGGATLQSITPSASQTLTAGSTATFTYNFTGTNTFNIGDPQPITTVMGTGESAQIQLPQLCLVTGAAQTIQFAMKGLPVGASVAWSANPLSLTGCGQTETATITTSNTTPPGVYSIQIIGTNQSGSTSTTSAWLSVNLPPASPDLLVSVASNGTQGNGDSGGTVVSGSTNEYDPLSVSADGHVIAFTSSATNLVSQNVGGLLVRDTSAGTTILGSAAADGSPASGAFPSLSADGNILVFASSSSNLPNPATYGYTQGIYVRDISAGTIARIDMAPDGTPGNGISSYSSISADGRFVAFQSTASNLLPAATSGGIFVYDRKTGSMKLASISSDESVQAYGESPRISASGRYVLFASSDPNLVPNDTNGRTDAFVHDFVTGETTRVNVASDGTQDTCGVITTISSPLAISADGRYVAFESCGDLVPGYTDMRGGGGDVYVHDMVTGQTSPLGVDQVGDLLNTQTVGGFSADGRFIAVNGSIIDQTTGEMTRVDVLSDGSGSPAVTNTIFYGGDTTTAFLSPDGSHIVFASNASSLVPNDNNGYFDVFEGVNSFLASPRLASISLSANQASGGTSVTGTLTLNAPAPIGGAAVSVWTDNDSISVPAIVTVPAGASSAPFSVTTSVVPAETVVAVLASYNSGSSVAVLALEPAAVLVTSQSSWNFGSVAVGTTSTAESFVLTNSGTAPLAISSIQMATGQLFTISANTCGSTIAPGGSCSVSVTFAPTANGAASDSVQITYGSPANTEAISVSGQGAMPVAVLAPLPLSFGNQLMPGSNVGTATLTNSGSANLTNISTLISGTNAADFTISSDGCSGVILPASSSCSVAITFTPKAKGSRAATLSITDNASGSPQAVSLSGVGIQSTPAILWTPSTASLTYGTALGGILNASAQGNGSTLPGTFAYTATISGGTPQTVSPATVLTSGAYTITATFTPTDTIDYTTATASISITVTAAGPMVSVVPGAPSVYTTQSLLVAITVSGGTGNPTPTGTVTLSSGGYTSAAMTLNSGSAFITIPANSLRAGTDTLNVAYTPDTTSASIYSSAAGAATVTVTAPAALATFSMSATSVTVTKGSSGTSTLTVNTTTGYSGTISFTCKVTSSPANAVDTPSCTSSQPVTLGGGTTSGTAPISVSTTAASTSALGWPRHGGSSGWEGAGGGAVLAVLVVLWAPRRKRTWQSMLGVLVVCAVIGAVTGCGGSTSVGGSNPPPTTNPGTTSGAYTITVTGLGNDSANTTATATFTLTVN